MQLTNKQEKALKIAVERYKQHEPYTVISGYAGSGKSTLVNFIVDALNIPKDKVAFIAYTGKAATVLKEKGCQNATTAHKLLYYSYLNKEGVYVYEPRKELDDDYKLIVVDEVSMMPEELWELLLSHQIYVLAMGDPGQLPPVSGDATNVLQHPDIFLDEVMRQAQDSAIIRLSMHIREGKDFRLFPTVSGEVRIIPSKLRFEDEDMALLQASQIICGDNAERERLNKKVRELQGRSSEPEIGDKIISLKNHWEKFSSGGNALTNGVIGQINNYYIEDQTYPDIFRFKGFIPTTLMYTSIQDDDETFLKLPIDYLGLMTGTPTLTSKQEYQIMKYNEYKIAQYNSGKINFLTLKEVPYQFSYGYAITCWKAQGSQYRYVLGYDCSWLKKRDPAQYLKYLYTLCTRAEQTIIMVGD